MYDLDRAFVAGGLFESSVSPWSISTSQSASNVGDFYLDLAKYQAEYDHRRLISAAFVGLVPVLLAWLLVYIVVWTVRWVRHGFQPAR